MKLKAVKTKLLAEEQNARAAAIQRLEAKQGEILARLAKKEEELTQKIQQDAAEKLARLESQASFHDERKRKCVRLHCYLLFQFIYAL